MSSNQDSSQSKKKDRAGTRRVTSLTAEQLERKRANDREAQRTIRQRTKEHIERLELQVAELRAKGDKFDEVVRRNAILENEIRALRHQLTMAAGTTAYQNIAEEPYSQQSGPIMPSSQYSDALGANQASSRTPSVLSTSSQVSASREWPSYGSNRSPSRCESSDTEYPARIEPWAFEGPSQAPVPMPIQHSHVGYHSQASATGHLPDPSFQAYQQLYHGSNTARATGEELPPQNHNPPEIPYDHSQRAVSGPPETRPRGYTTLQPTTQYQQLVTQSPHPVRGEFDYDWVHRS
ncbi:bZIP transcription factor [Aspergillus lucknowensis]|uniref:BZIP transcription factor n=1 Tax=Aspergillus lucknowensis TaxID=176173 RepID=A0ABR4LGN7_9EURO